MKYIISIIFFSFLPGQSIDPSYHTTEEIYHYLDSLDNLEGVGDWISLDTLGYSTQENIPIIGVRISDNADIKEDEPRVLFIGQVHAEEILGVEVVLSLINDLLFPDASIYTHMNILKQYLDIWLIPTANPEGLNVVHEGLDYSYRKNKRDLSPDGPLPNGIFDYDPSIGNDIDGVDLNRNFEFNWVFGDTFLEPDNSDYASHYDYYKGEEPFSENESIAIRDLALENDFVFSIVWHSSRSGNLSEKVFTSWKWEEVKESPDLDIMKSIADHFANSIETEDGTSSYLSVFSGSRNGKLHDWFYTETGCIQYLVECGTANLQPDSVLIDDTIERTKPAMVYLMDRAIGYYTDAAQITGIVYDESTGAPIEGVRVTVLEHNGSVLKPRLTNEFGRFRRILDVGTYSFRFDADGYLSQEYSLVANNSGITEQEIYLSPSPIHRLTLALVNENSEDISIVGRISNKFGTDEIELNLGDNHINLSESEYDIEFFMDGDHIPWGKTIFLESDMELTVPYALGVNYDLGALFPWELGEGTWCMNDTILSSQENRFYDNGNSGISEMYMVSEYFDVTGSNRIVISIDHRYEMEWDNDQIVVEIINQDNLTIGTRSWTGDNWNEYSRHLVTAVNVNNSIDSVKVRLALLRDETVNYRGWEIASIKLYAMPDEYLDIKRNTRNQVPRLPLTISGIYPNPSYGRLQLDLAQFPGGNATVNIYNLLGQNVYTKELNNLLSGKQTINLGPVNMDGKSLGAGMFFVKIQTLNEKAVKKCVILKN